MSRLDQGVRVNDVITINELAENGLFSDGDWVESKDQDPSGEIRLIQLADIGDGYFIDKSSRFLNSKTANRLRCTFLKKNDILIARMPDPIGRACLFPFEKLNGFVTVVDVAILRVSELQACPRYVAYAINSSNIRNQILRQITGTTRLRISKKKLGEIQIPFPPLPIQQKIAAVLDKADAIRKRSQQILAKYDQLAQSVFLEMFGDPVKNEKGWEVISGKSAFDLLTGYPFKSKDYSDSLDDVKICGGLIILPDKIDWSICNRWNLNTPTKDLSNYFLKEGDIVVAMDRPWISSGFKIGKIAKSDLPALLIQRTARIRSKALNQEFLYFVFKSKAFEIHAKPTETVVPHISPKDFNTFQIINPPILLQNQFASIIAQIEKQKAQTQLELNRAEELYQSLLQRAFTGELFLETSLQEVPTS